jgi:hypothetical protein
MPEAAVDTSFWRETMCPLLYIKRLDLFRFTACCGWVSRAESGCQHSAECVKQEAAADHAAVDSQNIKAHDIRALNAN